MTRRVVGLLVVAMIATGCTAGRAFRHGQDAVRVGDWDSAVTYFTTALQDNPENAEYKVQLERAKLEAARIHVTRARGFEEKDQLDAALIEYRRAVEMDGTNRTAAAKVAALEKTIRDRIEASRPKPQIDKLREQAHQMSQAPMLNPASREPLKLHFANASVKDILNTIGQLTGINVTYEPTFQDRPYTVDLGGVTLEEALNQILSANGYYYKVMNAKTIMIIPDNPQMHAKYDEMEIRVFYLSHADATEVNQTLNTIMRIPQMTMQPVFLPNKTANTITVRATAPVMDVVERVIRANDKPRAEVVLDIEILEVDRARVKHYGIDLSKYSADLLFSPEVAPSSSGTSTFNLNTISQGINTADFYLGVPSAVANFLENDNHTKTLAKPQLRGSEGTKLTLNLGQDIPVIQTVFGAAAAGGFATIPQSSYSYRTVGVNIEMTPRVTYDGEIVLDPLSVENSALGANIDVAGQSVPSFTSRKVATRLRLREGESTLLAGMVQQNTMHSLGGLPGILHVPGLKQLFADNNINDQDTDIVMLITPHIIRTHELTASDLGPIYIGTQQNVGLTGAPPLIAATPEAGAAGAETPAPAPTSVQAPNQPQAGVPGPPVAAPAGAQPLNRPAPPGTSPVPTLVSPLPPQPAPPAAPPSAENPAAAPRTQPPAATVPGAPAAGAAAPGAAQPPAAAGAGANQAPPAQVIVTPPGTEFRVAGGPYTVPVSIVNASRVSVITLTITYNPNVLRVRTVQDGTFMRQGGVTAAFTPRIDAAAGRVDIAVSRAGDQAGASGTGLLAALLFDAVGPGGSMISVSGVANDPEGGPVALTFAPVTVTVR
ncbi:MAG TPA: secretin and TonB N-terminal domain-containing protein [Vicinamibacterales bacterium]|nr:secretin and TonB N-terminal domain-containing protein [Vicinamibacterales bacterium]